jgi:hypothetical protein
MPLRRSWARQFLGYTAHEPIKVCTEGQLSDDERTEYETYVQALEFIAVLQAQARSLLTNGHV